MWYEINVAYQGRHFFATHERSLRDLDHAVMVFKTLKKRFPAADGFEVKMTKWDQTGSPVLSLAGFPDGI